MSVRNAFKYRELGSAPLPRLRFPILLVGLVMAVLLPMLAIGLVGSELAARQVRSTSELRLLGNAHGRATAIGSELTAHITALRILANNSALDWPIDIELANAALQKARATTGAGFVLLTPDGRKLLHTAAEPGTKLQETHHPKELAWVIATKQPLILDQYRGSVTHCLVTGAMVPVVRDGKAVGVLVVYISIAPLEAILGANAPDEAILRAGGANEAIQNANDRKGDVQAADTSEPDYSAILFDGNGARVASYGAKTASPIDVANVHKPLDATVQQRLGLFRDVDESGDLRIYARSLVPGTPAWTVLTSRSVNRVDAPWHLSLLMLGIGAISVLGLGTILSSRIARLVLVPIDQIGRYAARVAEANDETLFEGAAALPVARVAELEALRRGFAAAEAAVRKHTQTEHNTKIALQDSEARSNALLATLDQGVFLARDMNGSIQHWSAGCGRLYGWTGEEAIGRSVCELLAVRWPLPVEHVQEALRRDGTWSGEVLHRTRHGRELVVAAHQTVRRDGDGREQVLEVLTDVTAQRRAEATLGVVMEALPVGVTIADAQGRIIRSNAAHAKLWGAAPETTGWEHYKTWTGYHPESGERIQTEEWPMSRAIRLGETVSGELVECERFGTGERRVFITSAAPIRDPSGGIVGGVVADLDVTDMRLAEVKLAHSEAQLRTLIETVPIGLLLAEFPSGRIVGGNRYVETLLRHPVLRSPGIDRYDEWVSYHPDGSRVQGHEYPLARMLLEGAEHPSMEVHYQRGDGSRIWLRLLGRPVRDDQGRLIGGVGALMDIDEEYRARQALTEEAAELERLVEVRTDELRDSELRLAQAAKMEALGRLAGGVAHDFNNILQVVQGSADMVAKHLRTDPDRATLMLGMISDAASRGIGVTRRLLAFARRSELSAGPVDPGALLKGLTPMLHSTLGPMVTLHVETPSSVPMLLADQAQLETVLVNLVNNARDALPASGGRITLMAATAKQLPSSLADGRYIRLSVADTGMGMRPEILGRVTEPFFTTKGPGKGTGLGLAMARGFAEQSGGLLTIDSEMGRGTTVSLWLPVARNGAAEPSSQRVVGRAARSGPNVLLVDDDPTVRAVLSSILDDEGYTVSEADDSMTALSLLDTGLEADVLVTDLSMPGAMDGLGLVHAVRQRCAEMPSILITGHIEESGIRQLTDSVGPGPFAVLRKPVSARVLCATMEDVLAATTAPSVITL